MDGEIDLELYTICIIRLNSAFEKIENDEIDSDVNSMLSDSINDLGELIRDIEGDLSQEEINCNEYDYFFENGLNMFPAYIKTIEDKFEKTDDEETEENLKILMVRFDRLLELGGEYFKMRGIQ